MAEGLGQFKLVSFPSPGLENRILVCPRNPNSAGYKEEEPGTPIESCGMREGAVQDYRGFMLAKIQVDERSGTHNWYFVNEWQNQDWFNFTRGFLENSPAHQVVTRSYVVLREKYVKVAVGSSDPTFTNLTLYSQEQVRSNDPLIDSIFVATQIVYGPLPGPVVTAKRVNDRGDLETITRQAVGADTTPDADGVLVISTLVEDKDSIQSVKRKSEVTSHTTLTTKISGGIDLIPSKFRGAIGVEEIESIEAATNGEPLDPTALTDTIIGSTVKATSKTKATRVDVVIAGEFAELAGSQTEMWGEEEIEESVVDDSEVAAGVYKKKEESITPLGNGKAVKRSVHYPDSPATLVEIRTDDATGVQTRITKTLVDPASSVPTPAAHEVIDRVPIDKWHSIQIARKLLTSTLPGEETIPLYVSVALPDLLLSLGLDWNVGAGGATSVDEPPDWEEGDAKQFSVSAQADVSISVGLGVQIRDGYRGRAEGRLVRTYHSSLPVLGVVKAAIYPVTGTVVVRSVDNSAFVRRSYGGGSNENRFAANTRRFSLGPICHSSPGLTNPTPSGVSHTSTASTGSLPWGGSYPVAAVTATGTGGSELYLPACATYSPGSTVIEDGEVRPWRNGVYVREILYVDIPS